MALKQYSMVGEGFELHFSWVAEILRAQVEGLRNTYAVSLAYWTQVAEERRRWDARRILVVQNLTEMGSPDEIIALFDDLVGMGFQGCKVAFVDRSNNLRRSTHEYVAILARENDILAGVFGEESAAAIWLRHGEE